MLTARCVRVRWRRWPCARGGGGGGRLGASPLPAARAASAPPAPVRAGERVITVPALIALAEHWRDEQRAHATAARAAGERGERAERLRLHAAAA